MIQKVIAEKDAEVEMDMSKIENLEQDIKSLETFYRGKLNEKLELDQDNL